MERMKLDKEIADMENQLMNRHMEHSAVARIDQAQTKFDEVAPIPEPPAPAEVIELIRKKCDNPLCPICYIQPSIEIYNEPLDPATLSPCSYSPEFLCSPRCYIYNSCDARQTEA